MSSTAISGPASSTGSAFLKTLVATDLVDSTRMVEKLGDLRASELSARHDRMARALLERFGGREIDKTDGFLLLFERPILAVSFALAYHESLAKLATESGGGTALSARVGIHVGEVFLRENPAEAVARGAKPVEVEGIAKPIAARLMALARGGQTLLSRGAFDLARRAAIGASGPSDVGEHAENLKWLAHGSYLFKGLDEPLDVFEVGIEGWAPLAAPAPSEKARRVTSDETVLGWRPAPGLPVPHRPNWEFEKKLGEGGFGEVWLAAHKKTHERRVFKFCFELERVRALQREVTVCRLLRESLGNREDIARILDWNFDEAPYFLEFEYTEGGNLLEWVAAQGGFENVSRVTRFELVAQVADAVAAAHSVGVLHKDIKPANILVHTGQDGRPRARVTDFGIGAITDPGRLAALGITVLGRTEMATPSGVGEAGSHASGTRIYMAPEVLEGKPATTQADVYSLGVLAYQMAVGDLGRAVAPGWERDLPDPEDDLLREDLAHYLDGRPERRTAAAAEVASCLRSLEERKAKRVAERLAAEEAEANRVALARGARRRRLVAAAAAVALVFGVAMALQARRVAREAQRANREAAAAQQVTDFLIGLFEVSDPSEAKGNAITAREVLDRGAEKIEKELADQPAVQAKLKDAIGTVYVQIGLTQPGAKLLRDAHALRLGAFGADSLETENSVQDLGWVAEKEGNFAEAEKRYQEAIAIRERKVEDPANDSSLAKLWNDLGMTQVELARYDEGKASIQKALAMRERSYGPETAEVAESLMGLAYVHFTLAQFREAAELMRRVLAIREKVDGADSMKVAEASNNLAVMLRELGDDEEAERLYERSRAIHEKFLGPDHPDLASIHNNIAHVQQDRKELDAAEGSFRRALEIREKALGEMHPATAISLMNLGGLLWIKNEIPEAAQLWQRALAVREQVLGKEHPQTGFSIAQLALVDIYRADYRAADEKLTRALAMQVKAFGRDQENMLTPILEAEIAARELGQTAKADALAARAAALREEAAKRGGKVPDGGLIRRAAK